MIGGILMGDNKFSVFVIMPFGEDFLALFDELKTDTKIIKIDNFMEQRRKIWLHCFINNNTHFINNKYISTF